MCSYMFKSTYSTLHMTSLLASQFIQNEDIWAQQETLSQKQLGGEQLRKVPHVNLWLTHMNTCEHMHTPHTHSK